MRVAAQAFTIVLLGCGGEDEPPKGPPIQAGSAEACVGNNVGLQGNEPDELAYAFHGVVEDTSGGAIDFNLLPCDMGATHNVQVRADDGVRWIVGWRVRDMALADLAKGLAIEPGAEVDVVFHGDLGGKGRSGFAVSDEHGLVGAVDVGVGSRALKAGETPGLSVDYGPWVTTEEAECGTAHGYQVAFTADDEVTAETVAEVPVWVAGIEVTALAVSAVEYEESLCDGVGNELVWAAFRDNAIPVIADTGSASTL